MHIRRLLAASLFLATASAHALAAATPEEAARITASLQTYLGSEPGVVAVAPQGDDYIVTLNPAPYIAKFNQPGVKVTLDPVVLTIRPKGNGQWDVSQKGPYAFGWSAEGISTVDGKIAEQDWTGVFDEATAAFLTSTYTIRNFTINQTMIDPSTKAKTDTASVYESWTGTSTATPRPDGSIDASGTMNLAGIISAAKTDAAPGAPPLNYSINNAKTDYASTIKGFRSKAILDLVAWFVAHPSKELIVKDQQQLKDKVLAALPLWESLDTNATMADTTVATAIGSFALPSANFSVGMNGVSKDGKLREAFGVTGLTIPPGIAPPWTDGLIPHTFKFDMTAQGVDLEAPVRLFVAQADLAKDPPIPAGSEPAYLAAFAPKNSINLSLAGGEIAAAGYSLTYEGAFTVNFAGLPTGTATIRMKGLDDVLAKVQAAATTDPNAQQAMGGLVAFKGFGKAEADGGMVWAVDMTQPGKVLVNGIDVSALAGMAPPPQQ
jgi:hypothetical protein